eukprot:3186902-Heterocapsa_arctica.AAC.1
MTRDEEIYDGTVCSCEVNDEEKTKIEDLATRLIATTPSSATYATMAKKFDDLDGARHACCRLSSQS